MLSFPGSFAISIGCQGNRTSRADRLTQELYQKLKSGTSM